MLLRALTRHAKLSRFKEFKYFSTSPLLKSAYDSDGKTTVTMLNNEPGLGIMVDSFSKVGFRLNNGMFVVGPMVVFPKTVVSWNIEGDSDINADSLVIFTILEPKLDLLVIGFGNTSIERPKADKIFLELRRRRKNLNIELLPTEKATSTYNFLVAEGRFVAGAFIPPLVVTLDDHDYAAKKLKHRKLYEE